MIGITSFSKIEDGLVDAYEDALASVKHYLDHYDRPKLIEAMRKAIKIEEMIEWSATNLDK